MAIPCWALETHCDAQAVSQDGADFSHKGRTSQLSALPWAGAVWALQSPPHSLGGLLCLQGLHGEVELELNIY